MKHDHWSLKWILKILLHIVSIMVVLKQVKQDIQCLDENEKLLVTPSHFKWKGSNFNNDMMNYIGTYLCFDINNHKWVRSGKSTGGSGVILRHKQHEKQSKLQKGASRKFYLQYPSNTVSHTTSSNKSRRGYFQNL